jgi:hypothetical protein
MEKQPTGSLIKYFEDLPDPRTGNAKAHIFLEILIIAMLAVSWGVNDWTEVELFGKVRKPWSKTFLELPKGLPLMAPWPASCGIKSPSLNRRPGMGMPGHIRIGMRVLSWKNFKTASSE